MSLQLTFILLSSHARGTRKALKVADLKEILKKASVSLPPKPTKVDLITKILAEPAAVDAYNALHNPTGVTPQQDAPSKPKSAVKPDGSAANHPVSPEKAQVRQTVIHYYDTLNQNFRNLHLHYNPRQR